MGWVANTNPTGWYSNAWVWKFAVTVTVPMTHVGWAIPLSTSLLPGGADGGIDFFRSDPGGVTANGFDGSSFSNDAGFFLGTSDGTSIWETYGQASGDSFTLAPGTYYLVASVFAIDGSPPIAAPAWQPNPDWGTWVSRDGNMVNPPLIASGKPDGVGLYMVAVDQLTPTFTRLAYAYSPTAGLYEQGVFQPPQMAFAPRDPSVFSERAGGDLRGRTILPARLSVPVDATFVIPSRDARAVDLPVPLFVTWEPLRPVLTKPELIYAFSANSVSRYLADDSITVVDEISHGHNQDVSGSGINWGWVDNDDPTKIYGLSRHGVWQVDLITLVLTQLAMFDADQQAIYTRDGSTSGTVIGQRANGDIVTAAGDVFSFSVETVVHTWARNGSGLKTAAYLGAQASGWYPPIACAMLDDDTILIVWPIYKTPFTTIRRDRDWPKDLTLKFYTQSLTPIYAPAFYEALPDSSRLFTDGTTGPWTTMGRLGVEEDAPFLIDDSVTPHNGVGRTILSNAVDWEENQYVVNIDTFQVLPGDIFRFSVWLMPQDQGNEEDNANLHTWAQVDVTVPALHPFDVVSHYSFGDNGIEGGNTALTPGVWTQMVVNGTVPGDWPPVPGPSNGLILGDLRFENVSGPDPRLWISDISLRISGHRDVSMKNVANLEWPEPDVSADQSRYYQFINGFPMVLEAQTLLTGAPASSGVNFN